MVTCTVNWRLTGAAIQLRSYHGFEAPVTLGSPTRACCQDGWTTWLVHERIAEQRHQPVTELLATWPPISITADEPASRMGTDEVAPLLGIEPSRNAGRITRSQNITVRQRRSPTATAAIGIWGAVGIGAGACRWPRECRARCAP